MPSNDTLAQIRRAQQASQHYTDQDTPFSSEGEGSPADEKTGQNVQHAFIDTEPLHPATFHRADEGFSIGERPVTRIEPTTDTAVFTCYTEQSDGTTQEHPVQARDILLAAEGLQTIPMEREADWFSAYLRARGLLKMLATIVFTETTLGAALRYAWGSAHFLEALGRANELLPLFPTEFSDTASLFAACLSLENVLARLSRSEASANLAPFVQRVLGGTAFLDAFSQLHRAQGSLPALIQADDPLPPARTEIIQGTAARSRAQISVIDKKDEAEPLRDEIVEQGKNTLQLYIALVFGATSFLAILAQPNVPPLTACLLPLAVLSIAMKIAAHDLRPGQINFYLRRVLRSPYEIVRRILIDGSQPSEQELLMLSEQGIEITPALRAEAKVLQPFFPDMHSKAHRIAALLFDCAALSIIVLHAVYAFLQHDSATLIQAVIAFLISVGLTVPSVLVLRRKRVR